MLRKAAGFLSRVQEIDAPPELVTRIAYQIPVGRPRDPLERRGLVSRWVGVWRPVLQPRFAMGMAMTILSFAMLERCTGIQVQHIKPADLSPVRIWDSVEDKAIRGKDRAVKYYENLRLVYEVETRLKDLREQQDASAETDRKAGTAGDGLGTPQTAGTSPAKGDQKK